MNPQPLPEFLADLSFSLGGNTLSAFPLKSNQKMLHFGLEFDEYPNRGLFMHADRSFAEVKCSQAITRWVDGQTKTYTAYDDDEPTAWDAAPFETWVRGELSKEIDSMRSWYLETYCETHSMNRDIDAYRQLCAEFAGLPDFEMNHFDDRSFIFRMLAAVSRTLDSGEVSASDLVIFEDFVEMKSTQDFPYTQDLAEKAFKIACSLLPEQPALFVEGIERRLSEICPPIGPESEAITPAQFSQVIHVLAKEPSAVRFAAHPRLLTLVKTDVLAHIAVAGLNEYPNEARLYADHGLDLEDVGLSFLAAAECCYLNCGDDAKVESLQERLETLEIKEATAETTAYSEADIQLMIDRYTHLANDFRYFNPKSDPEVTGPELLKLEHGLNQYWFGTLPESHCLSRDLVERRLIRDCRFLSAGSTSYLGWLRTKGRHQEVVDELMKMKDDGELITLRSRSNQRGFEALLNNAFGSFLDSKVERHIEQAIELLDAIEPFMLPLKYRDAPYNLACIAARAGQVERAIEYIETAVKNGIFIGTMSTDEDLENVWNHKVFRKLLKAHG